jgi:hypothetical protein
MPITLIALELQGVCVKRRDLAGTDALQGFARNRKEIHFFLRGFGNAARSRAAFLEMAYPL